MSKMPEHYIADLNYSKPCPPARLPPNTVECACGLVLRAKDGTEWAEHRRTVVEKRVRTRQERGWSGTWSVKS